MRCTDNDIQPTRGLERHFEVRTLHPMAVVLESGFLFGAETVIDGDIHVISYVNETWREPVEYWNGQVRAGRIVLHDLPIETGRKTEQGYVIDRTQAIPLRFDGWFVRGVESEPAVLRPEDICPASEAMSFQRHFEIRLLCSFEEALAPSYFADVRGGFKPGDCLQLRQYANDDWTKVVSMLPFVRVDAIGDDVTLIRTAEPIVYYSEPERGFKIISSGETISVRHDGRTVAQFQTMVEANEYIARNGYHVRKEPHRAVLTHLGNDLQAFPLSEMRHAWQRCAELAAH